MSLKLFVKKNIPTFINKNNVLAFIISIYFSFTSTFSLDVEKISYRVIIWLGIAVIVFPLFRHIFKATKSNQIQTNNMGEIPKKEFLFYFIIILLFFCFYFIALFPGGQSPDTIVQWEQAINNKYNDWHPVIHTFLFYKIPSLIIQNYTFAVIWQIVIMAIIISIVCYEFRSLGFSKKTTLLLLLIIVINPYIARIINIVWKDVAYSYILLLITMYMIFIVNSNGKWLANKKNIIKLSIILLLTLGFRHNGIICYIYIIGCLFLFYYKYWKSILVLTVSSIGLYVIITNPIFTLCKIEKHSAPFTESLGIAFNQISYIYNNNGKITEENQEYLNKIANLEVWKNNYNKTNFNPIKWDITAVKFDIINDNPIEFIQNYYVLVKNNLGLALKSYYNVTSTIWSIEDAKSQIGPLAANFRYNKESDKIFKISDIFNYFLNMYNEWINNIGIGKIFLSYGGSLFLIFLSIFIISNSSKMYIKKYLPFVPVLSNTLSIMFLITGGEHRFILSQVLCAMPLLFYGLSDIPKKKEDNSDYSLLNLLFLEKTENSLLQFFRYIFVGLIAAFINISTLYLLTDIANVYYIFSNVFAFILGLIVNFLLSKKFVFSKEKMKDQKKEFITYAIIGLIGLGIDTILMFVFTSFLKIFYLISKIISTAITFIWNFCARKYMYKNEGEKYE